MGLDISAYENVTLVRAVSVGAFNKEGGDTPEGCTLLYSTGWPERADGLADGIYETSGECVDFRAGSYSGYNRWREWLAEMVGTTPKRTWDDPKPGPFFELICFADNEGVIGPTTSAKLAKDFADWTERAEVFANLTVSKKCKDDAEGAWWLQKFADWKKAFELAAKGGAVLFA